LIHLFYRRPNCRDCRGLSLVADIAAGPSKQVDVSAGRRRSVLTHAAVSMPPRSAKPGTSKTPAPPIADRKFCARCADRNLPLQAVQLGACRDSVRQIANARTGWNGGG
jgi:ribosomal protein S14